MNGLGRRQRAMLVNLTSHGRPIRKFYRADLEVLESLHRKGLVTAAAAYAALTPEGERLAGLLIPRR